MYGQRLSCSFYSLWACFQAWEKHGSVVLLWKLSAIHCRSLFPTIFFSAGWQLHAFVRPLDPHARPFQSPTAWGMARKCARYAVMVGSWLEQKFSWSTTCTAWLRFLCLKFHASLLVSCGKAFHEHWKRENSDEETCFLFVVQGRVSYCCQWARKSSFRRCCGCLCTRSLSGICCNDCGWKSDCEILVSQSDVR